MIVYYVSTAGADPVAVAARQTALATTAFDPTDAVLASFAADQSRLPAVLVVRANGVAGDWLHDDGTLTGATVAALGAPFAAIEAAEAANAAAVTAVQAAAVANAAHLNMVAPSSAQVAAQVAALTAQINALIAIVTG